MLTNRIRLRNRLLQFFYKPRKSKPRFVSADALSFLEELEEQLEEKIAPLLADLFK